jgi:hypothetical protein
VTASISSLSSTLTTESSTATIVETEIITSIGPITSQTSSIPTSSLSSIQIGTQQSTLSTEEGEICDETHIKLLLYEFIL